MYDAINLLVSIIGSHEKVAFFLGYSDRQYRNIRRKIRHGEELPPRISNLITVKLQEIQQNTGAHHVR